MDVQLSICIATYNRAKFIGQTLDSIVPQLVEGVEVLVVDGASPDNTREVVEARAQPSPPVRYVRLEKKGGIDRDYDLAIGMARGRYCWFFSDDDIVHPGAVRAVLDAVAGGHTVVVVNAEMATLDLSTILKKRRMALTSDRDYGESPADRELFFRDVAGHVSYIGALVVERAFWLSRERARYFGSSFAHVGALFGSPLVGTARVLADPWVTIRSGNAEWFARTCQIWLVSWPTLIWSFTQFSDSSKAAICRRQPWKRLRKLVLYRALKVYSLETYRQLIHPEVSKPWEGLFPALIAGMPVALARSIVVGYCRLTRDEVTPYGLHPDRSIKRC